MSDLLLCVLLLLQRSCKNHNQNFKVKIFKPIWAKKRPHSVSSINDHSLKIRNIVVIFLQGADKNANVRGGGSKFYSISFFSVNILSAGTKNKTDLSR